MQKIDFSYRIFCLPACSYPSKLADVQANLAKVRSSLANGSRSSRPCERRSTLRLLGWRAVPTRGSSGFGGNHGPAPVERQAHWGQQSQQQQRRQWWRGLRGEGLPPDELIFTGAFLLQESPRGASSPCENMMENPSQLAYEEETGSLCLITFTCVSHVHLTPHTRPTCPVGGSWERG